MLLTLEKPNIESAKNVVAKLNEYAKKSNTLVTDKDEAEMLSDSIKNVYTEDYRVSKALDAIGVAEKNATNEENKAADWLVPNSFGRINEIAANESIRKAKELREKANSDVVTSRDKLDYAMRKMDAILRRSYDENRVDRVIILHEIIKSINKHSLVENPFQSTITAEAVKKLKDFRDNEKIWLADAKSAENAENYEKAFNLFTKARNTEGRKRNALKLATILEKNKIFGSAIEYYEYSGSYAQAKALRVAHPNLLSNSFTILEPDDIYEKSRSSCVRIISQDGTGSGFLFKRGGYILTNNHVVKGSSKITVITDDDKSYPAELVAYADVPDLSIIKIDLKEHDVIHFSSADFVKIGSPVVLIGYPVKDMKTATMNTGRISNTDRTWRNNPCYQLDVSANHGNSGGPVLDARGRLVGILTFGLQDLDIDRFNFAIRVNVIQEFVEKKLGADYSNN